MEQVNLFKSHMPNRYIASAVLCVLALLGVTGFANAQKISNPVAVFSGLNKITAVVTTIEVPINQTVRFGTLNVTPRVCYTRPPTEPPRTTAFVEVNDVRIDGAESRIFTGWMFASSPGLHGVEHPVYDVWLINCRISSGSASSASE